MSTAPIAPPVVRYIKLGRGGGWERECIETGIARFGYGTERDDRFLAALEGRWGDLSQMFRDDGKDAGTATRFTHDVETFFTEGPETLWVTFYGQQLWWAFLEPEPPERHPDTSGTFRNVVGAWCGTDLAGAKLTMDRLAGSLTKLAAYRSTTFALKRGTREYIVRRINGERSPEIQRAEAALAAIWASARELIALLEPRDFELLVDLIFTSSGWRRLGAVGGTQKTLDLDIELPSTGERAFVQVKSATRNAELGEYVRQLDDLGAYQRLFFVYHTGHVTPPDDGRVVVIGPDKLAEMAVDAGLVGWLVGKVG
jgi:hypothetical protein